MAAVGSGLTLGVKSGGRASSGSQVGGRRGAVLRTAWITRSRRTGRCLTSSPASPGGVGDGDAAGSDGAGLVGRSPWPVNLIAGSKALQTG